MFHEIKIFSSFYLNIISGSANTSVSDGPTSPTVIAESLFDNEQENNDVEALRHLLQEVSDYFSSGMFAF